MIDPISGGLLSGGLGIAGDLISANMQRQTAEGLQASNQAWLEHMSSTQYQRGVADLKAAGLNPMLAYMSSAAPTPGSSAPSAPQTNIGSRLQQGLSSAMDLARFENEKKTVDANAAAAQAQASLANQRAQTELWNSVSAEAGSYLDQYQKYKLQEVMEDKMRAARIGASNDVKEQALRSKGLDLSSQTQSFDFWRKRLDDTLGTVNSAVDVFKPGSHGGGPRGYTDEYYDAGGEFRGQRSRSYHGDVQ